MSNTAFSDHQFASIYPPGIERFYWNHSRNMVVKDTLRQIKSKGILEIGAGAGIVTSYLKNKGMSVWGVELAPIESNEMIASLGDRFFIGKNVDEIPLGVRQEIDTVLLLDVIEHINDPADIIKNAEKHLPNLKKIVVTVPARNELWSNYDEFNGHYRRYDRKMLVKTFDEIGWHKQFCSYYFHALYWPAWLLARMSIKRKTKLIAPKGWKIIVHSMLAKTFFISYKVLPRFLVGSSIVAVFQK